MSIEAQASEFFKESTPPSDLTSIASQLQAFLANKSTQKLAIVTSGGTTVPLEKNTVRFIDNFSVGTRGAVSAEYFLDNGYAVVFLYRNESLQPWSRLITGPSRLNIFDQLSEDLKFAPQQLDTVQRAIRKYKAAVKDQRLLQISYTTVSQYIYYLKEITKACSTNLMGPQTLLYMAAAVSDFYIPNSQLSKHKIQSNGGQERLQLDLAPMPKFLRLVREVWLPEAMLVTFKLETDPLLLLAKCKGALKAYNHQLVIGNLLHTRSTEVVLVTSNSEEAVKLDTAEIGNTDVESKFIPKVIAIHELHRKLSPTPN